MKRRTQLIILGCVVAAIISGFVILALIVSNNSEPVEIFTNHSESIPSFEKTLLLTIKKPKSWVEKPARNCIPLQHEGAEYDFIATNTLGYEIDNWTLSISFKEQIIVDSKWNCEYRIEQNDQGEYLLILSTDKTSSLIPVGVEEKFGVVLHSVSLPDPLDCKVSFYAKEYRLITDYVAFRVLVTLSVMVIFIVLVQVGIIVRVRKYKAQQLHDEEIIIQSINTFVNFIDAKDPYTRGHSTRVALYSKEIAARMHLSENECKNLYYIALMHDVGKISIPDSVLQKPGKLTSEERNIIESHTSVGANMLRDFNALPGIVNGALYHHERYDGTGYPQGLAGEEIPLFARIICVADSYDAMSSRRCYRAKLSLDEILHELNANSGKQFDPEIVKHMVAMLEEAKATGRLYHYNL